MMKVRHLRPWELAETLRFAKDFHAAAKLGAEFSEKAFLRFLAQSANTGSLCAIGLFHGEQMVGCLIGIVAGHFLAEVAIAQEIMWWVDPDYRTGLASMKMLPLFEKWAKEKVAAYGVVMASFAATGSDDRLPAYYEKRGFQKIETHFFKSWPSSQPQ